MKTAEQKLRELIGEMISEKTFDESKEVVAKDDETIAKMKEENSEMKARIDKLEATPAKKVDLVVPAGDGETKKFLYKGYDLRKQGMDLSLPEDRREEVAKWLIDSITKAPNQEDTASEGGYLVPDEFQNELLAHARLSSVALRDCRTFPMKSDVLRIPREDGAVAVVVTAEEDQLTASNPTFAEVALTAAKIGAYGIISNELLQDSAIDIVSMLTSMFAEAIGQKVDDIWMNGTTWTGILSGGITTNRITCASTTTIPNRHIQITDAELSNAIAQLANNKLAGSKYYLHRQSLHYVRQLTDSNSNRIWALPNAGQPANIYGYPYEIVETIPSAPNAGDDFLVFGNMRAGYILGIRRGEMTLEMNPYSRFDYYQTQFRMASRIAGAVGLEDALVAIETSGP